MVRLVLQTNPTRNRTSWGLEIFSLFHARDKTKSIFLYFFTELKTYHLSYSVYKNPNFLVEIFFKTKNLKVFWIYFS